MNRGSMGALGTLERDSIMAGLVLSANEGGAKRKVASRSDWRRAPVLAEPQAPWSSFGSHLIGVVATSHTRPLVNPMLAKVADPVGDEELFSLSPATLRLVRAGLVSTDPSLQLARLKAHQGVHEPASVELLNDHAIRDFVSDRLVLLLTTAAGIYSDFGFLRRVLNGPRGFTPEVEMLIKDRIPVLPRSFGELSDSLHLDLRASLIRKGLAEFAWGSLELDDVGAIIMVIIPPPADRVRLGRPARRIA